MLFWNKTEKFMATFFIQLYTLYISLYYFTFSPVL